MQLTCFGMRPEFAAANCYVNGCSPLACASANGHASVVRFLIARKAFPVNEADPQGQTALSLAAGRAQRGVISILLSMVPSSDLDLNQRDYKGRSAIFMACNLDEPLLVQQLVCESRTDADMLDNEGRSALSWACEAGFADTVETLVRHNVRIGLQDRRGMTPLMYAVKSRDFKTVKILLRHKSRQASSARLRDINKAVKDHAGRNAVSWAASIQESRILELLLYHFPEEAKISDINGWFPLAWAMNPPGFLRNARQLIPHCGDVMGTRDYAGNSLLGIAVLWAQWDIAQLLLEQTAIKVNMENSIGRTALSLAAASGPLELVRHLVALRNASPAIVDSGGRSPLDWARRNENHDVVAYLQQIERKTSR